MHKKNLEIIVSDCKNIPKELKNKYGQSFNNVENEYNKPYLVFLCELAGILDADPNPVFIASSYTDVDMFGGRSQYWQIRTRNILIDRALEKEINDSWQSVTIIADTLEISGILNDAFIDWNGSFAYEQKFVIGNISDTLIETIINSANKLFKTVKTEIKLTQEKDKIRSELKRQYKLTDKSFQQPSNYNLEVYGELLLDEDEDTANGAIENLKEYFKKNEYTNDIKIYLKNALNKAAKYVRHAIIEAVGYSFNKEYSDIITLGLKDNDYYVKESATKWAKHFYHKDAIPYIIKNSTLIDQNLRWAAVSTMGELIKGNEATKEEKKKMEKALADRLKDDYRYVKEVSIMFLSELKDQKYFKDFVKLLKDTDSMIRSAAVTALGVLNHPDTLSILTKFEENEYDEKVLSNVQHVIKKLKSK